MGLLARRGARGHRCCALRLDETGLPAEFLFTRYGPTYQRVSTVEPDGVTPAPPPVPASLREARNPFRLPRTEKRAFFTWVVISLGMVSVFMYLLLADRD